MANWESDDIVDKWLHETDENNMPLPNIEFKPHLLISKVRKHYMEYIIKLLSVNYEKHQQLMNKNIYFPSAIWRCAKIMEMSAAQASMVVQLYRENITNVINGLKTDTKKGLLYRKLYNCLHYVPENEKKTQTTQSNCTCQCSCTQRKKIKSNTINNTNPTLPLNALNLESQNFSNISPEKLKNQMTTDLQNSDELMKQLEKLFQEDTNDDDLFDATLCADDTVAKHKMSTNNPQESVSEGQLLQKHLEQRLTLFSGVLVNSDCSSQDTINQNKKDRPSKWLCEEYFQKVKLLESLDQLRDCDRNKLVRIKTMLLDLFGEDSDDEDILSPLDESSEFVMSCKERIAPWVVKMLTPYYVKGRIRGKNLFKSLAKHLIKLIYQCSKYPYEYEVQSFIRDFLNSHKMIRCEADFKQFRIENF